jgi:hypothetical protein
MRHVQCHIQSSAVRAERQAAGSGAARHRDRAGCRERSAWRQREHLDVVARTAADVDLVAGRAENDADEAVRDANRLPRGQGIDVDEMQRSRIEVAPGHDGQQTSIRAEHHAERPIVHLDMRARRRELLAVRHENSAVRLNAYVRGSLERNSGCGRQRDGQQ